MKFVHKLIPSVIILVTFLNFYHPYHICTTQIKYDSKGKTIQVSAKLFTNDLETALRKLTGKKIDLINPINKEEMDSVVKVYFIKRFQLTNNDKKIILNYVGFEKEDDSIWIYAESKNTAQPKKIAVTTKLLYDYLHHQVNIVQTEINGSKQSKKITNPDNKLEFTF